jgi:hypothetical protein
MRDNAQQAEVFVAGEKYSEHPQLRSQSSFEFVKQTAPDQLGAGFDSRERRHCRSHR